MFFVKMDMSIAKYSIQQQFFVPVLNRMPTADVVQNI